MSRAEDREARGGVVGSEPPILTVVNADATAEEIAALVAVFSALGSGDESPPEPVSEWSSHHRRLRRTFPHGPGGWRSSALPH